MSATGRKADIAEGLSHVRFVPKADSCGAANSSLFNHLVRACKERLGDREPERLRGGKDTPATLAAKEQLFRSCLGLRQIRPELAWWRVWRD